MTLLDFPGNVACTVFLGGCDFRCPFCHNAELLDGSVPGVMDDEEFFGFLKKRVGMLDGVAITGGEPLLRPELPSFVQRIHDMGFKVKVDTAGNHPDALEKLLETGCVDYVAMDIKNSPERYAETVGLPSLDLGNVKRSIGLIMSKAPDYEFRTTVLKEFHDADSFRGIADLIEGAGKYFIQCFVDRETVPFAGLSAYTKEELEEFAEIIKPHVGSVQIRGVD